MQQQEIHVKRLHPNPDNPRKEAGDVSELAASIRRHGVLEPLLVIPAPWLNKGPGTGENYLIEAGYRRWVAGSKVLNTLPCIVRTPHPSENINQRALVTGLVENLHRDTLTAMEKARAYGRLRDEFRMTQAQIATETGLNVSSISRYLTLLELAPAAQERVAKGTLSVEDALAAVKKHRAMQRTKKGQKQIDVGWEPDHFTRNHHLAKKARTMCDAREHTGRRRYDGVACGQCWETVIRQDQSKVDYAEYKQAVEEAGGQFAVPFLPPMMTAGTSKSNGQSEA